MTLLYLVAAWLAGLFLASSSHASAAIWLGLAAGLFLLAYFVRQNRPWRLALVCAALFALGAGRYAWVTRSPDANHISHYVDSGYVTVSGIVSQDADIRDSHINLHVQVETRQQDDTSHTTHGLILVQAPRYEEYAYGDRITASGQLLTPPEFDDFSYRDYLARRGIYALMPDAQVEILVHDQGRPWYDFMYTLKDRARKTIDQLLPSPQAPLLNGILLGVESAIPDDVREAFNRTGTAHIIAISGANIIIVMGVMMRLLTSGFGKRRAGWFTLAAIVAYTIFVGADPAVVRAAIMGSLSLLAVQWGRRAYGLTSLAFAIWLMTLWNPLTLWDIGFQLSVAATAGLVLFGDDFTRGLQALLRRFFVEKRAKQIAAWLTEPVAISLAAQVTTTPLILVYFERLSLASLFANILIVPVQSYIMILGWLAVFAGLIWQPLGELTAWIVWIPLTYTLNVVRQISEFNWASVDFSLSPTYAWIIYALLLITALLRFQHRDDRAALFRLIQRQLTTYSIIAAGLILCILIWITALSQPDGKLHIWFLDIGHGHAVLIQTPNGAQILVDGGPNPTQLRRAVGDELPFWDRDLDMLIVTQPKSSAIGALPALLDRYNTRLVLTNGQVGDSEAYHALTRIWQNEEINVIPVTAGYQIKTGDGVLLEVLHPQQIPDAEAAPEDAGMVLRLSYETASFLLTPDLTEDAEQALLDAGWYIGSTVLELPSFGDADVNAAHFIETVRPQMAVVSVGSGNRTGLPDPEVVEQLTSGGKAALYRTDHDGTVELVTDGQTLQIYTRR